MLSLICFILLSSWAWLIPPDVHWLYFAVCLSLSGLSQSTAERLDKTHQESTQIRPQLQLQTHPSWLQERRQWQVSVCSVFCAGVRLLDLFVCLFYSGTSVCWWLVIQVTVDVFVLCCQYFFKPSESSVRDLSRLICLDFSFCNAWWLSRPLLYHCILFWLK